MIHKMTVKTSADPETMNDPIAMKKEMKLFFGKILDNLDLDIAKGRRKKKE